jgi:IS1 family transposase
LIQVDEIWTFCKKKQARLTEWEQRDPELGDQYVFVAIDAKTKLIPTFTVGKRDGQTALAFMEDLSRRLEQNGRIQLTSDGFNAYIGAVEDAFGGEVDYAQLVKVFGAEDPGRGRYSPP